MLIFFGLVGDANLVPQFPFDKNMSSAESFFYLHDALIVNPLELFMGLMLLGWLGRKLMRRRFHLELGELFWPVMAFTGFIFVGHLLGTFDRRRRPHCRLGIAGYASICPLMLILVTNLVEKREHFSHIMWAIYGGALHRKHCCRLDLLQLSTASLPARLERLTEHGASIHTNVIYIFHPPVISFTKVAR